MNTVFLSDVAASLEGAARDVCRYFGTDPDEIIDQDTFFGLMRFPRWQIVAGRLMDSMKETLPLEAHSEFHDLTVKAMGSAGVVYH